LASRWNSATTSSIMTSPEPASVYETSGRRRRGKIVLAAGCATVQRVHRSRHRVVESADRATRGPPRPAEPMELGRCGGRTTGSHRHRPPARPRRPHARGTLGRPTARHRRGTDALPRHRRPPAARRPAESGRPRRGDQPCDGTPPYLAQLHVPTCVPVAITLFRVAVSLHDRRFVSSRAIRLRGASPRCNNESSRRRVLRRPVPPARWNPRRRPGTRWASDRSAFLPRANDE
jgi:hypothetical protein